MKSALLFLVALAFVLINSCVKCKTCTYYEEVNDSIVHQEPLAGDYCGDDYRALEKKEYPVTTGKAYVKCVDE